jgi:hypothetical protein
MYYNRRLSDKFASLLKKKGDLRWLFNYVKSKKELECLICRNNKMEWISVYRGLSRILSINPYKNSDRLKIHAAQAYENIAEDENLDIYGKQEPNKVFRKELEIIIKRIEKNSKFDRYYKNEKEGYFQNILSRTYGISGNSNDPFVIIDKESVIGYDDKKEKCKKYGKFQHKYKKLQKAISNIDSKRFGRDLIKKAIGNEVDFLAIDTKGSIKLIEYKHGTNTAGIYLSPLQIGMYYEIFSDYRDRYKAAFDNTLLAMLKQKQKIGLVNADWKIPKKLKEIVPVLIVSKYNRNSVAKLNFKEILKIVREETSRPYFLKDIEVYDYTRNNGLIQLYWA